MGVARASCLLLILSIVACPAQAGRPFAGLILYALDKGKSYLLLANYAEAKNTWAGFTGNVEWAPGDEALNSAIRNAVGTSRCYFSFSALRRSVESVHFQEPWENPTRVSYFARVPRVQPHILEDGGRPCPEASAGSKRRPRLRWVPWTALRADMESKAGIPDAEYVRLVSSARHFPGMEGEQFLLPEFAETVRRMLALSERKDSTMEFTLPW